MYIEIKDNKLKCLKVKKSGSKYKLLAYQEIDMDFESSSIQSTINELKKVNGISDRKVQLLFNNKQLFYREVRLPLINTKKTTNIFTQEMTHALPGVEDVVADYITLDQNQTTKEYRVLGSAMEKKTIEYCMDIFKQAGLGKVKSINSYNNAIIGYINKLNEIKDACYIVADISTNQIKLFLFENGKFIIVRTTRDLANVSDLAINEEISKMMQFQSSRSKTTRITSVYYYTDSRVVEEIIKGLGKNDNYELKALPILSNIEAANNVNSNSCVGLIGMMVGE